MSLHICILSIRLVQKTFYLRLNHSNEAGPTEDSDVNFNGRKKKALINSKRSPYNSLLFSNAQRTSP